MPTIVPVRMTALSSACQSAVTTPPMPIDSSAKRMALMDASGLVQDIHRAQCSRQVLFLKISLSNVRGDEGDEGPTRGGTNSEGE